MPQTTSEQRMARLVAQLEQNPGYVAGLPGEIGAIVEAALNGASVHAIAHDRGISTEAVWGMLGNAAREASGQPPAQRVETGGLGADTDPGVTGGYGATGFGDIEVEPPGSDEELAEQQEAYRHGEPGDETAPR